MDVPHATDEWYGLIGRFVVAFEHTCRSATLFIHYYLPGHSEYEQKLKFTLLRVLRAQQVHDVARAFLERSDELTPERDELLKAFDALIKKRNFIVHSAWTFGDPMDNPDGISARTFSRKLSGDVLVDRTLTVEEATEAINEAHKVDEGFQELMWHCFNDERLAAAAQSAAFADVSPKADP